jgi:hypothetical protein
MEKSFVGRAKIQNNFVYKYKIKKNLEKFSYVDYTEAKRALPRLLNINKRTFEKYLYVRLDDRYDIPAGHLAMLAYYFRCKMEEMINYSPARMLDKEMRRDPQAELAARLGLTK